MCSPLYFSSVITLLALSVFDIEKKGKKHGANQSGYTDVFPLNNFTSLLIKRSRSSQMWFSVSELVWQPPHPPTVIPLLAPIRRDKRFNQQPHIWMTMELCVPACVFVQTPDGGIKSLLVSEFSRALCLGSYATGIWLIEAQGNRCTDRGQADSCDSDDSSLIKKILKKQLMKEAV